MLEVVRLLLNKVLQKQLKSTHLETGRVKKSPGKGFLAITALNHSNELTVLKSRDMGQEVKPQWRTVNQATEENCNQMSSAAAEEDCLATCRTATEHQQQRRAPAAHHQLPYPRDRRDGSVQGVLPPHELGLMLQV